MSPLFNFGNSKNTAVAEQPRPRTRAESARALAELKAHVESETKRLQAGIPKAEADLAAAHEVFREAQAVVNGTRSQLQGLSMRLASYGAVLGGELRASAPAQLQQALTEVWAAIQETYSDRWMVEYEATGGNILERRTALQAAKAALEDLVLLDLDGDALDAKIAKIEQAVDG